eukprot:GEMP01051834.1.p1 GENE.GEMP01051834.1~~GEMP01051834.1.p1  ORF type:complete len:220 (+),score=25.92 GEMP01051834.1:266-925(+)
MLHTVVGLLEKHLPLITEESFSQSRHLSTLNSKEYQKELLKAESLAERMEIAKKLSETEKDKTPEPAVVQVGDPTLFDQARIIIISITEYGPMKYVSTLTLFFLDVLIWTSLQLFLDNIGKKTKKRKSGRSRSRSVTPTPLTSTQSKGRLQVLTQEDVLARYVDEYFVKVSISIGVSFLCRLPAWFLHDGLVLQILMNLIITLRGLALVTFFIQDEINV